MKKIVIIAGDHSGDIYGGRLAQALKAKYPGVEIYSFAGENLAKHSTQVIDLMAHSVMGLVEVISSLKRIVAIFNKTIEEINKIKPDLIIPIDFPDFNLRLVKKLNKRYPIFYYVSPQVWAWREARVKQIRQYTDRMIVLFRFEEEFYQKHAIAALYFGHPLLDTLQSTRPEVKNIITFMPGSRKSEIKRHLPLMLAVKNMLEKKLSGYQFRVIRPRNIVPEFYTPFNSGMEIVERENRYLEESKFVICCSGTATLELAILGIPYLIVYKTNQLTWAIAKLLVKVKFAGIVNILSGKKVVEEFLQDDATAENIAQYTYNILTNTQDYSALKEALNKTRSLLLPTGHTASLAQYIGKFLEL